MKKENRVFVALYNEDNFKGITVPLEMKSIVESMQDDLEDVIDVIFDDYDDYRDYEVECSQYARDESAGTTDVDNMTQLLDIFHWDEDVVNYLKDIQNSNYQNKI